MNIASRATRVALVAIALLTQGTATLASDARQTDPQGRSSDRLIATSATRQLALGVAIQPDTIDRFDQFVESVDGHVPALWAIWNDWGGATPNFPTTLAEQVSTRGSVPFVWWQPVTTGNLNDTTFSNQLIIAGTFDDYIRAWATDAKAFGQLVIVRFAHEMDSSWFPWGVGRNGNTAGNFVAAWRHVVDIFRSVGATNVRFLWSPYSPNRSVYPGAGYVDYVGFTALNWGRSQGQPWRSMVDVLAPSVQAARSYAKPIIVPELAAPPDEPGQTKANWIRSGYPQAFDRFPEIVALVYFNVDTSPGQPDWRLTTPPAALDAYREVVARPEFQGSFVPAPPSVVLTLPSRTQPEVDVTLTAVDPSNSGIAGYYLSEDGTLPDSPSWSPTEPATFTFSPGDGTKTLFAWVRNGSGRTSARSSATTIVDSVAPTPYVTGVTPASPTRSRTLSFVIAAQEWLDCKKADANDFSLTNAVVSNVETRPDGSCGVNLTSTIANSQAGTSSVNASSSFSISDIAGNSATSIAGLPAEWTLEPRPPDDAPPVVQPPEVVLITSKPLAESKAWMRVTWPAASDDVAVSSYQLQRRQGRGPWQNVQLQSPTSLSMDLAVPVNTNHTFRLRARDDGGNWSLWKESGVLPLNAYEERSPALRYIGEFRRTPVDGASGGFVRQSSSSNTGVRVVFTGVSIAWVSTIDHDRGIAEIWLDGVETATIDLSGESAPATVVWAAATGPGRHELEIRVAGTHSSSSTSSRVDIDAILVLG